MQKLQKALSWAIIVSETTHVFCCVLPVIVSTFSLLSVVGLVSTAPAGLTEFHEFMHAYEIPLITFSGVILVLGWILYGISKHLDCRSSGCGHEPCQPKKNKVSRVLQIATLIFAVNLTVYLSLHLKYDGMSDNQTHVHAVGHGEQHIHAHE